MSIMTERSAAQGSFELLASLTARLASTARLDEIVDAVLGEIVQLGFGAVWMAVLDEPSGNLLTLKEVIEGVDTTHEMPAIFMLDMRQPIGHGFKALRMINIADPDSLFIIENDGDQVPEDRLALPRVIYDHLRGHPFACGPLLGSRGQPVGALGLSSYQGNRPIPDDVLAKGLLRAFMDHLGIAMERALHLSSLERVNDALVRAQTVIAHDARIKAIGELAAAVAHDLNNLSGIALMAISIGKRSHKEAHENLPRIERATRAISELVGRLQRAALPSGGHVAVTHANVRQVVEDLVAMARPLLAEHSIALTLDVSDVSPAFAEPSLIHQVLLNLVLNAQDALAAKAPDQRRLRIRVRDDDGVIRISVADNGPGIHADVLRQLFKPFVTTKQDGHVGLGLAAAHASLQHLGGRLEGRNAPGGGAVFEITLPVAENAPPPPVETSRAEDLTRRTARILAVDDDPDILNIIRDYLEPLGYHVTTVTDGDRAIELASRQPLDLVLCDVGMPRRSGLDVCVHLRQSGFQGRLVLMTGWDRDSLVGDQRAAKCDTLLQKPFVGSELVQVIDGLLMA